MSGTSNYARHVGECRIDRDEDGRRVQTWTVPPTGALLFFGDDNVPAMVTPQHWAFWRLPKGADPATFASSIIGEPSKSVHDFTIVSEG